MDEKQFEVVKRDNYTVISVLVEKLDTHIAPAVKSESSVQVIIAFIRSIGTLLN